MTKRLRMNSEDIQQAFPDVYRDFFLNCEVVVSAERALPWVVRVRPHIHHGLGLLQKIPLKVYVGIRANDTNKIRLVSSRSFVPYRGSFSPIPLDPIITSRLTSFLNREVMKSLAFQQGGFDIHILSELPFGHGLNVTGAFCSALATALMLYAERVTIDDVQRWQSLPVATLIEQKGQPFDLVFRLALKLELVIYRNRLVGIGSFCALIPSRAPVAFLFNPDTIKEQSLTTLPDWMSYVDRLPYWAARLNELIKNTSQSSLVIQFGLLYSGDSKYSAIHLDSLQDVQDGMGELGAYVRRVFPETQMANADRQIKNAFRDMTSDADKLWQRFLSVQYASSLLTFKYLTETYQRGYSAAAIAKLFDSMNKSFYLHNILNLSSLRLNRIQTALLAYADRLNLESGIGTKIAGIGKRGDILFAITDTTFYDSFDGFLESLRQTVHPDIWLDYASWIDGYGERGVTVEQDLSKQTYSAFIERQASKITVWSGHRRNQLVLSSAGLKLRRESADLFIDRPRQKIYCRGRVLTSKDIRSTKETISLLALLLGHLNTPVPASALPPGPYHDRTAMQGKIISPLKNAVEKYLGRELPLTIKGGLRHDFSLELRSSKLEIIVLNENS